MTHQAPDAPGVVKIEVDVSAHKAFTDRMTVLFDQMATRMNSFQLEAMQHHKCLGEIRNIPGGIALQPSALAGECEAAMQAIVQAITDACAIFNRHQCEGGPAGRQTPN